MMRDDMKLYLMDSLYVTLGFLILLSLMKMMESTTHTSDVSVAKILLEQAAKWYKISLQDTQNIYSMQHANYSVAYLNAARHIASDTTLERISGLDIHKLFKKIDEHQRSVMMKDFNTKPTKKIKNLPSQVAWLS